MIKNLELKLNKNVLFYFFIPFIVTMMSIISAVNINYGVILIAVIFSAVLILKKQWLLYLMIVSIFLEGHVFSVNIGSARVRGIQVLGIFLFISMAVDFLLNKRKIKNTNFDFLLFLYMCINTISIINAVWIVRSVKINLLLLSCVLIYYCVYNMITSKEFFNKIFNILLITGVIQILYGIYQIFAGMLNYIAGTSLYIGYMGLIHTNYIGAPWGRPYGTFIEPDWYGAICMFYALLFIALYYTSFKKRKLYYSFGLIISIIGLFFSFVRAAWLGLLVGSMVLYLLRHRSFVSKIDIGLFFKKAAIFFILLISVIMSFPKVREVLYDRISPADTTARFDFNNIRFLAMKTSFNAFLRHPVIGNGPGSAAFNYMADQYGEKSAIENLRESPELRQLEAYDPNIITTVLEDTGIAGFIIFTFLIILFVKKNIKQIFLIKNEYSIIAAGTFAGVIGLFVSYIFTHGFWIPFTWVFIAINLTALKIGMKNVENIGN